MCWRRVVDVCRLRSCMAAVCLHQTCLLMGWQLQCWLLLVAAGSTGSGSAAGQCLLACVDTHVRVYRCGRGIRGPKDLCCAAQLLTVPRN